MEKVIHKLINEFTEGVDTYTHNGSTWLIFTDTKQWVIELTEEKTLWYNYNFFKGMFAYTSMDVVENQHYITQWVEDNIINKVKDTILEQNITEGEVEGIIEMAVKENSFSFVRMKVDCENVIENGVKETKVSNYCGDNTEFIITDQWIIDRVIENGVKEIRPSGCVDPKTRIFHYRIQEQVDDVVDNGEKVNGTFVGGKRQKENIESVIGYGTKNPTD